MGWILKEARLRCRAHFLSVSPWDVILRRNELFDSFVCEAIEDVHKGIGRSGIEGLKFFAYSYSATAALKRAASMGAVTVLGQIDGGPYAEEIVLNEIARYPHLSDHHSIPPQKYWQDWRDQCSSASRIIVNSSWAAHCMGKSGIPREKVVIVPLFFQSSVDAMHRAQRKPFPSRFEPSRPLRVLFMGSLSLQKGAGRLFEAMRQLSAEPIEFWIVGPTYVRVPDEILHLSNARFIGAVARTAVAAYYQRCDVLVLPTLSDGFAITQLEAQAYGMPVVASTYCGEVVTNDVNGLVLSSPEPDDIADALIRLARNPTLVERLSENSHAPDRDLISYGRALLEAASC